MLRPLNSVIWLAMVGLLCLAPRASLGIEALPVTTAMDSALEESLQFLPGPPAPRIDALLRATIHQPSFRHRPHKRLQLDISPLVDSAVGFLRHQGIPLHNYSDRQGRDDILVSAAFHIADDLPAVNFHLGEQAPDLFGAFYTSRSDVSCALVWPVRALTLRLEGGDDSEFGYYAIAGAQWHHPSHPLAAGVGVPMNLRNAKGNIGVIFQLRMKLP